MNPSTIRAFGLGGAGCRFVDALAASAGGRLSTWAADTDFAALSALGAVPKECRHLVGDNAFGAGSGGQVSAVRGAALAEAEVFRAALEGVSVAIVAAGLAGGTGGGALPVFLEAARERNVRTLVFGVKPFRAEGVERLRVASAALQSVATLGDVRFFPSNDDLCGGEPGGEGEGPTLREALGRASFRLVEALAFFWRLCADPGFLRLDSETLRSMASEGRGDADFAVAEASGEGRLEKALSALWDDPASGLRRRAGTARAALVGVIGGDDLRLSEIAAVSRSFEKAFPASFPLRLSTASDPALPGGAIRLVAFLFRSWQSAEREEAVAAALAAKGGAAADQDPLVDARGRRMPGRFDRVAGTFVGGENLDLPTYIRRNLLVDAT